VQKEYPDRAPRVVWDPSETEKGPYLVINEWSSSLEGKNKESCAMEYVGMVVGGLGVGPTLGRGSPEIAEWRANFKFEDYPGPWEPSARLKDQDKDGVEAEVLFASHLRHFYEISETDEPFARAMFRSYNNWLMDFCSYSPKRLIGLPVLSVLGVEGAVEDLRHYAKRGAKGFMMGASVPVGRSYGESIFDPLWAEAQDLDVPLAMHTTTGKWKRPSVLNPSVRGLGGGYAEVQASLAEMIYGGIFDRFPKLKIVISEFDIGWVAHMVGKLEVHDPKLGLQLAPAEYLRRNVWFTFQDDRAGCLTTAMYGENNFLWSNDFPHGVTTWPDSQAIVDRQFEGISEEIRRKITRQNTIDLYKLDLA
jgi:predicted TIM-barrel fold metal-dependent hydrolase